ncbi:MAG: hypothetical protein AAFO81_03465 [Pseudomonadota bacterium]
MWLKFALVGSLLTPLLHVIVLIVNGQDPIATPISQLSQFKLAYLHTLELTIFGCAHVALAIALNGLDHGRLWPYARGLLVGSGAALIYIAWYFVSNDQATLTAANANDPLWIVASLTGTAIGTLQPGLSRLSPRLGLFSAMCLGIWILLVPLTFFVNASWLGAYERIVGAIYVIWMVGVSAKLLLLTRDSATSTPAET